MTTQRKTAPISKRLSCYRCGCLGANLTCCDNGYVCEECATQVRQGRDNTTRAVKTLQRSIRGQAQKQRALAKGEIPSEQLDYDIAAAAMLAADAMDNSTAVVTVSCGEALPGHDEFLQNTMATPGLVALDASAHRLELVTSMGTEIAAMALDASDSVMANNSLEKMLAHQMAVLHDNAMRNASKAALEQDPVHSVRLMNLSIRSMETYQKGLLALKRLRGTGEQRITIQHVDVRGGQAVITQGQQGRVGAKP